MRGGAPMITMKKITLSLILLALASCELAHAAIDTITVIQPQPTQITITSSTQPQVTINTRGNDTLQLLVPGEQGPQGNKGNPGDVFAVTMDMYSDISTAKQYKIIINNAMVGVEEQ